MPYMTLKELIQKLNYAPKRYKIDPEKEVVVDAFISIKSESGYPPGTIVFECQECNTTMQRPEDSHYLSLAPDIITTLN